MQPDSNCIFCKIVAGQIPAKKVYEDVLIVPKQHIVSMVDVTDEHAALLGRMMAVSPRLMRELGVTNGFRHVVNTGRDGMQEVQHLHLHVMGGPRPWLKG
jgi:histidine triad (HIT) family protein